MRMTTYLSNFTTVMILAEAEKVEKDRAQSAERIHSLHTRLHQEAEKIRKWKTSTEIEIKEKVKYLTFVKFLVIETQVMLCYLSFLVDFLFALNWLSYGQILSCDFLTFFFSLFYRRKSYRKLCKQ